MRLSQDEIYMKRCLQIAKNGLGTTRPNPMVGAVIVLDNKIIGEGFTSPYGGSHAEVNAINAVKDEEDLKQSTLYVTLEPCSHYGKTPPCSDLIVEKEIPRVVIGCKDDNPAVAGKGIEKLKASGCNVTVGVLEEDCKQHHKRFFTSVNKKRPYIILKWAESQDGFIAPIKKATQRPVWITNIYSRLLVHKWRAEEQAILVGRKTVIDDNPSLTVRHWTGKNPVRVVLDRNSKLNLSSKVFDKESKTIIIGSDSFNQSHVGSQRPVNASEKSNIGLNENIIKVPISWEKDSIAQEICEVLHKENISSIIIEGGAKTIQTFIDEDLWDEARVFCGSSVFKNGTKAPHLMGKLKIERHLLNDTIRIYEKN